MEKYGLTSPTKRRGISRPCPDRARCCVGEGCRVKKDRAKQGFNTALPEIEVLYFWCETKRDTVDRSLCTTAGRAESTSSAGAGQCGVSRAGANARVSG